MSHVVFTSRQAVGTKADTVYETLRTELLSGACAYGETLSTAELATELGVSRRPVMDAMMRLELAGFIEIIRQVGCRVVVPDPVTVREHFYTAAVLEGAAARLAAEHASAPPLEAALEESRAAALADDIPGFGAANKRLHSAIHVAARNQRLADLARSAWDLSDFFLLGRPVEGLRQSHADHEEIIAAVLRGDGDAARAAMEHHMTRFGEETTR